MSTTTPQDEQHVPLEEIGESLGLLRLRSPEVVREIQQSLVRHGQLTALSTFATPEGSVEVVDGFKRLYAARALGWPALRVRVLGLERVQAKAAIGVLNRPNGLTEVEEGWLVRSLYRDDGLTQPQIGQLLSRHKSWVCRRLMLVEALAEAVQMDVRLGLLGARAACELSRLPRDNQQEVADCCTRRGLTTKQTARLVAAWLASPDEATCRRLLAGEGDGVVVALGPAAAKAAGPACSPAQVLMAQVEATTRAAAKLQAGLLAQPLVAFGAEAAETLSRALLDLLAVLEALRQTAQRAARMEVPRALPDEP